MITEKYSFTNEISSDIDSNVGDGKNTGNIKVASEYDILKSLKTLLNKVINKNNPDEYWSIIKATNELVVKASPDVLATIQQVVDNINTTALKQVDIKITVYEVSLDKKYQYGINWGYVNKILSSTGELKTLTALSTNSAIPSLDTALSSPAIFKYTGDEGISTLVSLLNNFGKTILSYQIPLKTTNNIPAVANLANKKSYISKFTISTTDTQGQISIEQADVTGGEYVYLKPTILDNQILLSLKMVFSNINDITKQEFGNGQYVQTPDLSKNVYNQNIVLHSGDKIIIGGITKKYNKNGYDGSTNENSMFAPLLGVKNKNQQNTETVIIIEAKEV